MEWGGNGDGEVSLQATWDQDGRDRSTQRGGIPSTVSKRGSGERGVIKGNQQGELARGVSKELRHGLVSSTCTYVS
jgi:hypothetical protein